MSAEAPRLLNGRVALVTGAGRGIGRSIAIGLAAMGVATVLLARSQDELDEVASTIAAVGGAALAVRADVADRTQVASALDRARRELGPIDIVINNAAVVWPVAPSTTIDIAEFAAAIEVNVIGAVALSLAAIPAMLERGWGRIVNVSSGVAGRPQLMTGANAYVTSKAALEAHTLNLAVELSGSGVTANVYRPGGVDTAMQRWIRSQDPEKVGAALHERFVANYEGGSLISPEESAASLLRRLSSDATGEIWDVQDR